MERSPGARAVVTTLLPPRAPSSETDSLLRWHQQHERMAGVVSALQLARGSLAAARGDFAEGMRMLTPTEVPSPGPDWLAPARLAAIGSWMGTVSVRTADSVLKRAREASPRLSPADSVTFMWLDGVVGLASNDSLRVHRAAQAIAARDTASRAPRLSRSLSALWRARDGGPIDSLRALEDESMARHTNSGNALVLHRWTLARALLKDNDAAGAERYLQWADAYVLSARTTSYQVAFGPYNSYLRGLAFEAAGNRARAIREFETFLRMVDRPGDALASQVEIARASLRRLTGDDAARTRVRN